MRLLKNPFWPLGRVTKPSASANEKSVRTDTMTQTGDQCRCPKCDTSPGTKPMLSLASRPEHFLEDDLPAMNYALASFACGAMTVRRRPNEQLAIKPRDHTDFPFVDRQV